MSEKLQIDESKKQRARYVAPELRRYGTLAEMTQANPGPGSDGGTTPGSFAS